MKSRPVVAGFLLMLLMIPCAAVFSQEVKMTKLLPARVEGSNPFMKVLNSRKTQREFSAKELSLQDISDLLWAADGINRQDSGLRTAPSAMNMQEIDIYLAKEDGLFLYDPKINSLDPILMQDIRELTGKQPFVKDAPVDLIYVADLSNGEVVRSG